MKKQLIAGIIAIIVIAAGFLLYYEFIDNTGSVNVKVADAPNGNVSAVYITFDAVYMHSGTAGWKNYSIGSKTVNILHLTTTNASLLSSINIPPGKYTMIRLAIVNVTVKIGMLSFAFTSSNGYVDIVAPFTVTAHASTTLVIDFNLTQDLNMQSQIFTPTASMVVNP
ncbi:MAG: DUF4382 domain-containing protein [Candidatus Thermoplasmatota archaeon]|nr:DUF4382 domain-containing protein [Candidatus Thermoplasmatota archaeon]